jgi:pimeloyl-ACP methyl ester carboxylesterase
MKNYPLHFADLPGGERLAYRKAGSGAKTVLLIHGNMSSSVHWQTTMESLEGQYTIYAPDLRGFGSSSYNAPFDSLLELAGDLEQFCGVLGIGGFSALGWSTGGGIALELAASLPERVNGLVLLDSVPPTGYPMFKKDAAGAPMPGVLLKTKEEIAADPIQVLPALNALAAGDRAIMRAIWNAVIYNLRQPPEEDYEQYLDGILGQRNLVDVDYALLTFNMTDVPTASAPPSGRLAKVVCPVTILHGEKDLVVPLDWGKETARLLGDRGRLVTFPASGHSPVTDEPQLFFDAVKTALTTFRW